MSIYLRLNGKNYETSDFITLGRGVPFLTEEQTFARKHARLKFVKGKWYIKDLGSKVGIIRNSETLKKGKFIEVKPGEKIFLGNIEVEIFAERPPGEVIKVSRINSPKLSKPVFLQLVYSLLLVVLVWVSTEKMIFEFRLGLIGLTAISVFIGNVLGSLFLKSEAREINEIAFSAAGMTFHFQSGENYSFLYDDVESWNKAQNLFRMKIHGKDHRFLLLKDENILLNLLLKNCPKTQKKVTTSIWDYLMVAPVIMIFAYLLMMLTNDFPSFQMFFNTVIVSGVLTLAFVFSEKIRTNMNLPGFLQSKISRVLLGVLVAFCTYSLPSTYVLTENAYATKDSFRKCEKNPVACRDLDFDPIRNGSVLLSRRDKFIVESICKNGNQNACEFYDFFYARNQTPVSPR